MKELKKLVDTYEQINASDELKERIKKTMKNKRRTINITKIAAGLVASLMILSVVGLNLSPSFAYAMSDIPVLGSIVKVVTLGRYENVDNGYEAKVVTPKIEGLLDKKFENELNEKFQKNAQAIIAAYENDVKELKKEFGDETVHMGLECNYQIKTDNKDILALDIYILNTAGSSSTKHTFYNVDKKTGELLTLKGLFKNNSNYVDIISEYVLKEMKNLNKTQGGMFWVEEDEFAENFKKIKEDQNFYINNDLDLVICFDKYDVAAGAQGSPEFIIPKTVIKDILK